MKFFIPSNTFARVLAHHYSHIKRSKYASRFGEKTLQKCREHGFGKPQLRRTQSVRFWHHQRTLRERHRERFQLLRLGITRVRRPVRDRRRRFIRARVYSEELNRTEEIDRKDETECGAFEDAKKRGGKGKGRARESERD